jgi:hypothetical protein
MKNVSLDCTTVLQLYTHGSDGALNAAADCHVLRNDAALDLCAIADQELRGVQLAFDSAEDLRRTFAFDIPDDRHVGADARGRSRFSHQGLVMRLHRPDFGRTLIVFGSATLHATQHFHLPLFRRYESAMRPVARYHVLSAATPDNGRNSKLAHMTAVARSAPRTPTAHGRH